MSWIEPGAPHAVRWASRKIGHDLQFTRWHYAEGCNETVCGRRIPMLTVPLSLEIGDPAAVECMACKCAISNRAALNAGQAGDVGGAGVERPSELEICLELVRINADLICLNPQRAEVCAPQIVWNVARAKQILG